jgi:hypothetical protein
MGKGSKISVMGKLGKVRKPRAKSQSSEAQVSSKVRKPRSFGKQIKGGVYKQQP